ncbi:hypothetical protein GKE82_23885 [Conexibacter sp. W3-3-2]|nr:hypothetical protein [Conexibacter sp. W3-3-2]
MVLGAAVALAPPPSLAAPGDAITQIDALDSRIERTTRVERRLAGQERRAERELRSLRARERRASREVRAATAKLRSASVVQTRAEDALSREVAELQGIASVLADANVVGGGGYRRAGPGDERGPGP